LGFNDVGYNHKARPGYVKPLTPNLDALAASGVILDRIYTYINCAPSRASLLTGRLPIHVSQSNPSVAQRGGGIPLEMITIAEKLGGKGYNSYLIGKWHAGSDLWSRIPTARGFNHSFGMLGGSSDYYSQIKTLAGGFSAIDCWRDDGPAYDEAGIKYATHLYTDEALAAIAGMMLGV
jgi:arylsulfatase A-like enzyme